MKVLHVVLNNNSTNMGYNDFYLQTKKKAKNSIYCLSFFGVNTTSYFINSCNGSIIKFLIQALRLSNKVDIVHIHSHHLAFVFSFLKLFFLKTRFIYTVHTSYSNLKLRNKFFFYVSHFFMDSTVFVSESAYDTFPFKINKHSKIIRNGVTLLDKGSVCDEDKINIVTLGRLCDLKRPVETISAIINSTLNGCMAIKKSINIIGDGALLPDIKDIIGKNELTDTYVLGGIPRNLVYDYLRKSDLFISYSTVEGMPIAALEAASAGCYLILSDINPHKEIAKQLPYVRLVNSIEQLTQVIDLVVQELKEIDFKVEVKLSNSTACAANFGLERMLDKYQDLYENHAN